MNRSIESEWGKFKVVKRDRRSESLTKVKAVVRSEEQWGAHRHHTLCDLLAIDLKDDLERSRVVTPERVSPFLVRTERAK